MSFGGFGAQASNLAPAASVPSFSFSSPSTTPAQPANTSTSQSFGFGTSSSTPQPAGAPAAGGGLFGSQSQTQPAAQPPAATGGGLFGGSSSFGGAKPAQPAAPAGTGLFGSTTALAGGSSLFGAPQQSAQQQSGLFSQPQQQTNFLGQSQSGGLFGGQQQQQPAAQSSLFGQSKPAAAPSLFGQQSIAQTAPGLGQSTSQSSTSNPSGFNKTTKFTDLPENVQKIIEQMDSAFKDQKQIGASISTEHIELAIRQTALDVRGANDEYAALSLGICTLNNSLEQLASRVSADAQDLQKLMEVWEASKPAEARSGNVRPVVHRDFPHELFARVAVNFEDRVERYKSTITQLHRAIISLANDQDILSPQTVAHSIQNHQEAILTLAGQLEGLQLRLNDLRKAYIREFQERTNTMRDPFEMAREERGVSPLRA